MSKAIVSFDKIESRILLLRNEKVLLDADLAKLYGVTTKVFNQAVKRNLERFPDDFMFQLTEQEVGILRSQTVTSSLHGGRRYRPFAFTEQGVAMLSSVLRSDRAVQVNIAIMRTFVKLRQMLASNEELSHKLRQLERRYDAQFAQVFRAIEALMDLPDGSASPYSPKKKRIGYQ